MPTVKVRDQFVVHLDESKHPEGTVLEVSDKQLDLIKHQVEVIEKPSKEAKT